MKETKKLAIGYVILSALLYSIYTPAAKILGIKFPPAYLTAYLYLGSGIGLGILYGLFNNWFNQNESNVDQTDIFDLGIMIVFNIGAGILLNWGIRLSSAMSMSLVGNFEIVATTIIAICWGEKVSKKLWFGILIIFMASIFLTFNLQDLKISLGILLGLIATILWGFENNFTKKLSVKNPIQVVIIKGLGVGIGSYLVAILSKETYINNVESIIWCFVIGFFAFGLSILLYVFSQRYIGAAKTSAYYAISPFISVLLSFVILHEKLTMQFGAAFILMIVGISVVVSDTLHKE